MQALHEVLSTLMRLPCIGGGGGAVCVRVIKGGRSCLLSKHVTQSLITLTHAQKVGRQSPLFVTGPFGLIRGARAESGENEFLNYALIGAIRF